MTDATIPNSDAPSYAAYRATTHFASLNGLRFLCIAAVLWHHGPVWTALEAPAQILERGFTGVDFFFVLSGFLITTLLLREAAASPTGQFSLRGFYWRRCLRILPVYFLVVTVVAVYYIGVKGERQYLSQLPFYYLFLSNFLIEDMPFLSPTWSLAVEEQYYLIWPLLLMLLPRRLLMPLLAVIVVLNAIAVVGGLTPFGITAFEVGPLRFEMFNTTYAPILIGSAMALLLHNPRSFAVLARLLGSTPACLASFALVLVTLQWLPENVLGWPNVVMHLAMAAALVSIVVREDNIMRSWLSWQPISRMGEISYGIYLYHLIALHFAKVFLAKLGLAEQGVLVLVTYSLLSVAMAEVSFRTFERFFLNLKHKGWGKPAHSR